MLKLPCPSCGGPLEFRSKTTLFQVCSYCKSNIIKTNTDHRIAMAFAIMGTRLGVNLKIQDSEYISSSFPGFNKEINSVGGSLSE